MPLTDEDKQRIFAAGRRGGKHIISTSWVNRLRSPRCWKCHQTLESTINRRCEICGWLICHIRGCEECGCNYGLTPPEMKYQGELFK